jgi:hypothetical protein
MAEFKPAITRAVVAQGRYDKARNATIDALKLEEEELERFRQLLREAIKEHPEEAETPWMFHHLNNTLGMTPEEIRAIKTGSHAIMPKMAEDTSIKNDKTEDGQKPVSGVESWFSKGGL